MNGTKGLIFSWPAILTGYAEEKQWIHIPIMDDFLDDALNPAVKLEFQVNRHFNIRSKLNGPIFGSTQIIEF